jgi:adenylate cyclase
MPAKLKVRPAEGEAFEVEVGNTATIGRSRDNTVSLHTNPHVSRQHAVIRCHNAYQFQIMDLGSRNGTFVNGRRVITPTILTNGAVIRITNNELVFEQSEQPSQDATYDVTVAAGTDAANDQNAIVAVMVCDIRGFSTMSEILAEEELARTLGQWFRDAGNIVHDAGGTIDKFIGDAILAYWTRETQDGRESRGALDSALRLLKTAAQRSWTTPETKPFRIAVALHHGVVTCGNVGFVAQRDATIIGDTVNTVFRIESLMKQLNQKLAASQDFLSTLPDSGIGFNDLGEHQLKGKYQPVRLFGMASGTATDP